MTRFAITHTTRYDYAQQVSRCLNLAYMLPRNTERQACLHNQIIITPGTAVATERPDYFGNRAYEFAIEAPHDWLQITAKSTVDVNFNEAMPGLDFGNTCRQVLERLYNSADVETLFAREFTLPSPLINVKDDLRQLLANYAGPLFKHDRTFLSAVRELTQLIYNDFQYDPDFSDVSTPLADVFEHKRGVCQDFAHLAIGCLRTLGFPARYVSGYLETLAPPGQVKLVGVDASHAWFAVYSPDEGWYEFDPTNDILAGNQHIVTAWGRDYSDVPPLKGVVFGGGQQHRLHVSVHVERTGDR